MIREWIHFFKMRGAPAARELGLVRESVGIESRYRRNSSAWEPHLAKTRDWILGSADLCQSKKRVVVLGAGWLLDIPVRELSETFHEVILVDAVMTPAARQITQKYSNVQFIEWDVTGLLQPACDAIHRMRKTRVREELPLTSEFANPWGETSLMVSSNLISQLARPLCDALCALKFGSENVYTRSELDAHARKIMHQHGMWITGHSAWCMVADIESRVLDRDGVVIEVDRLVPSGCLPSSPGATWDWELSPMGEEFRKWKVMHRICAFRGVHS